jgi:hypothetical protein
VDDACAAFLPEIHEATLLSLQGPFDRVRLADEMLALLARALPALVGAPRQGGRL